MIEAARRCEGFGFALYVIDSKLIPVRKP